MELFTARDRSSSPDDIARPGSPEGEDRGGAPRVRPGGSSGSPRARVGGVGEPSVLIAAASSSRDERSSCRLADPMMYRSVVVLREIGPPWEPNPPRCADIARSIGLDRGRSSDGRSGCLWKPIDRARALHERAVVPSL
jgi:hypothetical protein